MAFIIWADGNLEVNDDKLTLEYMQKVVGGYIEIVPLQDGRLLVCNEEGKIQGLPENKHATMIWEESYGKTDIIMGNVIITNEKELDDGSAN